MEEDGLGGFHCSCLYAVKLFTASTLAVVKQIYLRDREMGKPSAAEPLCKKIYVMGTSSRVLALGYQIMSFMFHVPNRFTQVGFLKAQSRTFLIVAPTIWGEKSYWEIWLTTTLLISSSINNNN